MDEMDYVPKMTVKKILFDYIKENGYDGLYVPDVCSCSIDNFMHCKDGFTDCHPGYFNSIPICGSDGHQIEIGQNKEI